jgi:DNA polymerase-3 subunit gamma/tau
MEPQSYRVLARKYRPATFADLIGQEVLVRTITNAIQFGRIAHAFLLTGIRGIGKTTTARIIARALNCIGPDGNGQPTATPCGVCSNCKMIGEDRHPDIIEMDAASHTGVNDVRDIIDSVHYVPSSARYKVYIIDEVHMLSTSAFNALLKTLEEPPPHVKFIFATTELRKIPVTILSRCQRFDLRRTDTSVLQTHLKNVANKESITAEDEAILLIANAAEGSVRDALSLLDQAIAHSFTPDAPCHILTETVRAMLGMADKTMLFDLMETVFKGDTGVLSQQLRSLISAGADPILLLQDMMELVHLITRLQLAPGSESDLATYSKQERDKAIELSQKLPMQALTLAWQMLLKGLNESRYAPNPLSAVEMVLIRTCYASNLPTPEELVRGGSGRTQASAGAGISPARSAAPARSAGAVNAVAHTTPATHHSEPATNTAPVINRFEDIVKLFEQKREMILFTQLKQDVSLVSFAAGRLEINTSATVSADFPQKISKLLSQWTNERWVVTVSQEKGALSLMDQEKIQLQQKKDQLKHDPLVQEVLSAFPGAEVIDFKPKE